jgi:hypothetical protein
VERQHGEVPRTPLSRPPLPHAPGPGERDDFGTGVGDARREAARPPARPAPPPRREVEPKPEPRPEPDDFGSFGAGLS